MLKTPISDSISDPISDSTSTIHFLQNKNVFVFDTESTGLPAKPPSGWGSYWDYRLNEKYDNARIVSIAWVLLTKFDRETLDCDELDDSGSIKHYLRYPEGFSEILTTHIHGISFNDAMTKGIPLGIILDTYGLGKSLLKADYIIAHNVGFDYHVLLNELYRIVSNNEPIVSISLNTREIALNCINHLISLKSQGHVICTGELSTNICKMDFPNAKTYLGKKKTYKMPKLCELYKYYYGKDFENAHSADGDVKALLEVLKMM